jgi:hypothetical protein
MDTPQVEDVDWTSAARYLRHRPETTLLYKLIEQHWPAFKEQLAAQVTSLPSYVVQ